MIDKKKVAAKDKESRLLEKIEKAKQDLVHLQERRKKEIGALAYKHGLAHVDTITLDKAFSKLAKELVHGNS